MPSRSPSSSHADHGIGLAVAPDRDRDGEEQQRRGEPERLLNAFAQPVMENTEHLANPLAIRVHAPLGDFGDLACLLAMFVAVLAAIVRHVGLVVRRDPAGRRVGRRGLPLTLGVVAMFVLTGVLTTDGAPLAANLITGAAILLSIGSVAVVGTRLVRD
jgi:hypothetical protein